MRKLTPTEMEDLTIARIEAGAVGQNAIICRCGRVIGHFPNGPSPILGMLSNFGPFGVSISNCVFTFSSCDWCEGREEREATP